MDPDQVSEPIHLSPMQRQLEIGQRYFYTIWADSGCFICINSADINYKEEHAVVTGVSCIICNVVLTVEGSGPGKLVRKVNKTVLR